MGLRATYIDKKISRLLLRKPSAFLHSFISLRLLTNTLQSKVRIDKLGARFNYLHAKPNNFIKISVKSFITKIVMILYEKTCNLKLQYVEKHLALTWV